MTSRAHSLAQEGDGCVADLIAVSLGMGQAAAVVDSDVRVLPADRVAVSAVEVALSAVRVALAGHPLVGAALDPTEPLDLDVDQLTSVRSLAALCWFQVQTTELAHADSPEDFRHGESAISCASQSSVRRPRSCGIMARAGLQTEGRANARLKVGDVASPASASADSAAPRSSVPLRADRRR